MKNGHTGFYKRENMFISKVLKMYSSGNLNQYNKSTMALGMLCGASHPHLTEAGQQLPGVSES